MKKLYISFILQFLTSYLIFAQHNKSITGTISDKETGLPVEFANVIILKENDSIPLRIVMTDSLGQFIFKKMPSGKYFIKYNFFGYNETEIPAFLITDTTDIYNLGMLPLTSSEPDDEVVVVGEKKMFENSIDKKIFNVDKDITSKSGSLSQALQNVPSVSVDMDGNVSLRGSENVTILINGKPSTLMGSGRGTALQQIPASAVERIEVITNPSAKYKPDGTAGIINIVLKKNARLGFNTSGNINVGNYQRYNGNVAVNYNPGKINLFGSYGIRQDNTNRYYRDRRVYTDTVTQEVRFQNQDNNQYARPLSHLATIGTDINLTKKSIVGVSSNFYYRSFIRTEDTDYHLKNNNDSTTSHYIRNRYDDEFETNIDFDSYYQHNFDEEGHELRIEYYVSKEKEQEDNNFHNIFYVPLQETTFDNTLIKQDKREHLATVEYTLPLEDAEIEAGYMGQFNKSDLDFSSQYYTGGNWLTDQQKTNRFIWDQSIHAFYGTYSASIEELEFMAGLRAEQTIVNSKLVTLDSIVPNNYFQLFPTLHLSHKFKKSHELQLNYSRRVNRPEDDDLNPFPEYLDPRNISSGNPKLLPENIHSVEFGYHWKNNNTSIMPTIFYRQMYNGITRVTELVNDSTMLTTFQNLAKNKSAGLELIMTKQIGKIFSMNISANGFYNQIDASNLGLSNKKSNFTWSAKWNSTLNITRITALQLNASYQSSTITPQGKMLPRYLLNIGARQDFLKSKYSMTLAISDVFNTLNQSSEIDTPWLYQTLIRKRQSRIIYLGISYRLGIAKKPKPENLKFDDKF